MKKHLSIRLASGIGGLFIIFSVILSCIFKFVYESQIMKHYKSSMKTDAYNISNSVSDDLKYSTVDGELFDILVSNIDTEYEFLLFEKLIKADIWFVDKNYNFIRQQNNTLNYVSEVELPKNIDKIIKKVFAGDDISEGIKEKGGDYVLSAVPLINKNKNIIGALILYASVDDLSDGFNHAFLILTISLVISLSLVIILAIYFSNIFTKPIKKIGDISMEMAKGNYKVATGINQEDEIGILAESIEVLAKRLEEARIKSEQSEIAKRDFLSKISHELKTPVTIIRGSLESLTDDMLDNREMTSKYLYQMQGEIVWLQKIIQELLDLTRLQTVDFKLNFSEFDVGEFIGDVIMSARILAKTKNIKVYCEPPTEEIIIIADYDRLRQLLMILIDNAIKYSEARSAITLILHKSEPAISIIDNGCGISDEEVKHIFEPYYRNISNKNSESTGLGLAIALEIAKRHNFKLNVKSEIHKGSEFKLILNDKN